VDMGSLILGSWYAYTGYFSGWGTASTTPSTDADSPRVMDSSVRYIRPCFRLNHAGGDGTMEIDYISLEVLTEATESNQVMKDVVNLSTGKVATNKVIEGSITAGSISTGKLQAGAVTANEIQAGTITATQIAANTITASQISANTITASQLATLTGGGLTINLAATGTQTVFGHTNFTILADGTATFSGALSAATGTFSGSLSAATGSFAGSLSAASGTFAGDLQAATISINSSGGTLRGSIKTDVSGQVKLCDTAGSPQLIISTSGATVYDLTLGTSGSITGFGATDLLSINTTAASKTFSTYGTFLINGTVYYIPLYV
jgi:hypothetical protein